MNEIVSHNGFRQVATDDFTILQAEAAKPLIGLCQTIGGTFIWSGCAVTSAGGGLYNIAAGIVWIDGKLREFPGTSAPVSLPCYIEAYDEVIEQRPYKDNVVRDAVKNYGARVSSLPYVPELPGGGGGV